MRPSPARLLNILVPVKRCAQTTIPDAQTN